MIDFEVQRCTRRCAATNRPLEPGEEFYSLLRSVEGAVERLDYCREAWESPEEGAIGWWRSRMPGADQGGAKMAPNEVLLRLFDEWADQPERAEARYVLALLLVRRKVFKISAPSLSLAAQDRPADLLHVDCPIRDESYQLPATAPDNERAAKIGVELNQLLYADAA